MNPNTPDRNSPNKPVASDPRAVPGDSGNAGKQGDRQQNPKTDRSDVLPGAKPIPGRTTTPMPVADKQAGKTIEAPGQPGLERSTDRTTAVGPGGQRAVGQKGATANINTPTPETLGDDENDNDDVSRAPDTRAV